MASAKGSKEPKKKARPGWAAHRERKRAQKQLFAKRLEDLMAERGWNQSETARQASQYMSETQHSTKARRGVRTMFGRDNITHYLDRSKLTIPKPEHLHPLARAFGVSPDYLLPPPEVVAVKSGVQVLPSQLAGKQRLVLNVDVTPRAFTDIMAILTADGALSQ